MKRTATGLFIGIVMVSSFVIGKATASVPSDGPTKYLLVAGSETMPYRIVLRHCRNAEDTLGVLRMVAYDAERVIYRCRKARSY